MKSLDLEQTQRSEKTGNLVVVIVGMGSKKPSTTVSVVDTMLQRKRQYHRNKKSQLHQSWMDGAADALLQKKPSTTILVVNCMLQRRQHPRHKKSQLHRSWMAEAAFLSLSPVQQLSTSSRFDCRFGPFGKALG